MYELSLVATTGVYSLLAVHRLLTAVTSLLQSMGSGCMDAVMSQTGLVAPWYVGSSWTRDGSRVSQLAGRFLTTGLLGKFQIGF